MKEKTKGEIGKEKKEVAVDNSYKTVYISNLSYNRDQKGLKHIFSRYGEVISIKIIVDLKTGKSKGMAFVEMSNRKEAQQAIAALNLKVIDGRTAKASFAIPQNKSGSGKSKSVSKRKPKAKKAK